MGGKATALSQPKIAVQTLGSWSVQVVFEHATIQDRLAKCRIARAAGGLPDRIASLLVIVPNLQSHAAASLSLRAAQLSRHETITTNGPPVERMINTIHNGANFTECPIIVESNSRVHRAGLPVAALCRTTPERTEWTHETDGEHAHGNFDSYSIRRRGSSASRSPSPTKFSPMTVKKMAAPGPKTSHGASWRY
jgi:hypothetical protein